MVSSEIPRTFDVAVIGAGVFGAWTAFELCKSGTQVLLIDAYGPANSRASSGDESRIIRMGYGADEMYTRSALRSLALWKDLFASCGERLFHQTGVLWLAHEDDPYPVKTKATLSQVGIAFEALTTTEVSQRFPQIGLDKITWAMLEPESGVLRARPAVLAVVRAAVNDGVEYLQDAVLPLCPDQKLDHVRTANGLRISAGVYVFACGPWLPKLFPQLLGAHIQPTRQEVFYFGAPAGDSRFSSPALPTWIDFKGEAYCLPGIESLGVKVAVDRHGEPFDPDVGDRLVSQAGTAEVRSLLSRRLPALKDAPVIEARVCQYENTSNGDFLIDRHPDFDNVWLVGGGSGHGFKHGPMVGEYLAARIKGSDAGIEPRFSLGTKTSEQTRAVY